MGCGKAKGLERRIHKSWYKTFGSSWLNILVFEFVNSITAWPLKISVSAWTKTTWRAFNSSRIRLKHASLDCLQNPEAFCQRCLQLEMTCAPLQSSKSSFAIVLPNYAQPVHFTSLAWKIQLRKFGTSGSQWESTKPTRWWSQSSKIRRLKSTAPG